MSELSDMIKNWNTDILKDEDRVYDSKDDINRLIKVIPLLGEGIIQMKTSTRNLMINGLPLDGKLYKGAGSDTSGIVEVVPEGTDYVYHMAKSGTTQGAWSIKSTDTTSISQIPYVSEDILFTNTLIKGSGTATLQFLDKDGNVLSEMTTSALTDTYQAFNVKGQLKDSVWSFKIIASDAIYFKQVMITRSSFPSDYMLSEEELEQLNIINTSGIDANTVTKSQAYQVVGLKNCPDNVSTSGLFITIQKDNFVQVFVPNDDTGIYYRVGVTTNRPNTKWTRLATSDNTYSKEDFTEMRTSDNINLIQDSSMSAGFWAFAKDGASTSVGSLNTADGIAHITGNGTSGTSWAQYQVTNQNYQQPLIQNSEIQYDQDYTVSVETTWSDGADIGSNGEVPPLLIVRESYKDGTSKDLVHVKAIDKYGYNKWHKLSGTFNFSENRKNDISLIQVILMWKGAKGDVYFRRPKLEMASLPSAYTEDTIASVEPNHNLLQDSRDLLNGWQKYGSNVSLDATGDMAWYQGMRVQHLFGDWSYYSAKNKLTLENGKYYTVSAYMRGLHEGDLNMYATILSQKSNSSSIIFPLAKQLTGEWKRYSYTFKFDASTQVVNAGGISVEGQGNWDSIGGSAYVAGIKLEEGKTATDWSPSIEETIVRYETQNWQKDKITADDGGLALRINVSGTDPMDKQFLSATGTKTFYLQDGATGNNTGGPLRGILIKDSPSFGNAYGITNNNELWFLKIEDSKLTTWNKVAKDADVMAIKDEEIDFRHSDMLKKTFETMRERGDFFDEELAGRGINIKWYGAKCDGTTDDSTAIQAVIDKFVGHQILFPANSKVVIKKSLALKSNTNINLNGSTLIYNGVKAPNMVNMIGVGNNNILKNVELKSGTLDGGYLCDYNFEMTVASGANLIDMKFADPLIANCNVHKDDYLTCDGFNLSNSSAVNSKRRMGLTSLIINTADCVVNRFVAVDYGRGILNGGTNYYNDVRSWCYDDAIIKDSVFMETSGMAMCSNMYMDTWFIGYKFVGTGASVFINQSGSFYNENAYKLTSGHKVPYMLWFDEGAEKSLFVATNIEFYGLQVGGSEFSNLSQMPTGVRLNNCMSDNVRGMPPDQSVINRYRDNTADADLSVKSNGSLHSNPETRIYKVKLNPTLTIRALKVGGKFTEKGNWIAPDQAKLTVNDGWLVSDVDSSGMAYAIINLTDALSDKAYQSEASDTYYIQGLMECGGELDINISGAKNGVVQNNAGTDKLSMIIQGYAGPGSSGDPQLLFKSASGFRLKEIVVINVTKELNTRYLMDTVSDVKTRLDKIVNNVWFEGLKQFSQGLGMTDKFIIKSVPKGMIIPLFPDGKIVKEGVSISDNTDNSWIYSKFYFNKASRALFEAMQTGGLYVTGSLGDHNPPQPNTNGINFYYDNDFKTILYSRNKPDVVALPSILPNNTIRVEFIIKDTYTGPYTATFRDVVLSYQNRPVVSSSEISIADDYQEIIGYKGGAFMIAPAADNQATMAAIDVI